MTVVDRPTLPLLPLADINALSYHVVFNDGIALNLDCIDSRQIARLAIRELIACFALLELLRSSLNVKDWEGRKPPVEAWSQGACVISHILARSVVLE